MAWGFINVSAGTIISSTINNYTPNVSALGSFTWSGRDSNIANAGTDIKSIATSTETLYTTNRFGVSLITSGNGILVKLYLDNTSISNITITGNYGVDNAWLTFVINDETEQANCLYTWYDSRDSASRAYQTRSAYNNASQQATFSHNLYLALKSAIIPEYTWQSVPAISGKNGILSLSTLVDINDGEAVDTTDATKVVLQLESNVRTLVDAVPLGSLSASGGGASGSNPQYGGQTITGKSGTQLTGYAFGQGATPGGGGGLYGGYGAEEDVSPAGAGSGYIGNPLLSNKKMYGYGVAKNTSESAYTISKSNHSIAAIEKKPKAGNGYARITYLRPLDNPTPPVWDGHFFNADFSTDGRDSVRYDSSRTCSFTIDSSAMEERSALQGQMFDCFEDIPVWTLSNGVLDIGNNEAAILGWLYDYANIDNKIIPPTSTFYIDMEVYCYQADTIELGFFTPINHGDIVDRKVFLFGINSGLVPYVETEDAGGVTSDYQIGSTALSFNNNEWHAVRCKIEMVNSYISKITVYLDGSEVTYKEFNSSTEPLSFVCINNNATYAEWFCRLRAFSCKIRKLSVGQDIS